MQVHRLTKRFKQDVDAMLTEGKEFLQLSPEAMMAVVSRYGGLL